MALQTVLVDTLQWTTLASGTTAMGFANTRDVEVAVLATATFTTTIPPKGIECVLKILTVGTTTRTVTFGTGFKSVGTLATGTVSGKIFILLWVSDGVSLIEAGRTIAH